MSITLIAVGKMKEKPYRQMADEYLKRLSRYGKVGEIELPDLPEPSNSSPAIEEQIKKKEGDAILAKIRDGDIVVCLCVIAILYRVRCLSHYHHTHDMYHIHF